MTGQCKSSTSGSFTSKTPIDDAKFLTRLSCRPFYNAVRAGTAAVMCSYNRINNTYGCQNSKVLNGLLKDQLGFQGFVVSDWGAQKSGVGSALAGLDMAMPRFVLSVPVSS